MWSKSCIINSMNSETTTISTDGFHRITTRLYNESKTKLLKEIVVTLYPNGYSQTVINGEWGYTEEWYDNRGNIQKFEHDVITEGRPSDIGKLATPSKYIIDSNQNIYNGVSVSKEEFIKLQFGK